MLHSPPRQSPVAPPAYMRSSLIFSPATPCQLVGVDRHRSFTERGVPGTRIHYIPPRPPAPPVQRPASRGVQADPAGCGGSRRGGAKPVRVGQRGETLAKAQLEARGWTVNRIADQC